MKYYIKELQLSSDKLKRLENVLYYEKMIQNVLLSDRGYFTISKNQYYHHFIDTKNLDSCNSSNSSNSNSNSNNYNALYWSVEKYLDNYTLYVDNSKWSKKKVGSIPPDHVNINITNHIYKSNEKCNVSFIIEQDEKGEIVDAYFLSHLSESDFSFQETLSYLLAKLIY
jgi:hypothetical protein